MKGQLQVNLDTLNARLAIALDSARAVAASDKDDFTAGRYDGLKQAVEILDELAQAQVEKILPFLAASLAGA